MGAPLVPGLAFRDRSARNGVTDQRRSPCFRRQATSSRGRGASCSRRPECAGVLGCGLGFQHSGAAGPGRPGAGLGTTSSLGPEPGRRRIPSVASPDGSTACLRVAWQTGGAATAGRRHRGLRGPRPGPRISRPFELVRRAVGNKRKQLSSAAGTARWRVRRRGRASACGGRSCSVRRHPPGRPRGACLFAPVTREGAASLCQSSAVFGERRRGAGPGPVAQRRASTRSAGPGEPVASIPARAPVQGAGTDIRRSHVRVGSSTERRRQSAGARPPGPARFPAGSAERSRCST